MTGNYFQTPTMDSQERVFHKRHRELSLLLLPLLIIFTGWVSDNVLGFWLLNFMVADLRYTGQPNPAMCFWIDYDLFSKWLLYGICAYIMLMTRVRCGSRPSKVWLLSWTILWLMLLFEVLARFFGLFNWMGAPFMRYSHYHVEWSTSAQAIISNTFHRSHWAFRPLYAFSITTLIFTLGRSFLLRK